MSNVNGRKWLLTSSMLAGAVLASLGTAAYAQDAQEETTQVSEIVVTGSRISRQDYKSPSPIVTVDAEDFQATGSVTIDSLMNDMPQFVPSISSTSNNPSNGGQANLNLRGLGTSRTLVLMNGRRVVPSNASGVVDVNILPTALIKNVEVISGGASAAYGSDALAGVANFILNESFSGVQLDAQYGETERGDGITESYSLTLGGNFADDRGNMVLSIGRSTREQIYNEAREFSRISGASAATPLGSTVFDSNNLPTLAAVRAYFNSATLQNTGAFGFNNDGSLFAHAGALNFKSPGGITYDGFVAPGADYVYNTGALNSLQLPLERWNVYAGGRYKINDSIELYGNALFTEYTGTQELAATPASNNPVNGTGFRIPTTNPFIPADLRALLLTRPNPTGSILLNKRFLDVGGRISDSQYSVYQLTGGMRGQFLGSDWTYDVYAQYGRVDTTNFQSGNVSRSAVQNLLDAADGGRSLCEGGFNPFGNNPLSAACTAYIHRTAQNISVQEQTVVEATFQGKLMDLPAGEARAAVGMQYRQDDFLFRPDASLAQRLVTVNRPDGGQNGGSEIAGFNPQQPLSGSTSSKELFAEVLIPLIANVPFIDQLELTLGGRYSDYSTVGGVTAWKADLDWAVTDGLRVRGGYNYSVRAPSIGELYAPLNTSFPSIGTPSATGVQGDPCDIRGSYRNGPNAAQVRALCIAQGISAGSVDNYIMSNNQVPGVTGGNPDLTEETGESWSLGVVYQPQLSMAALSNLSFSVDYYNIEITDVIGTIGASAQLQGCYNANGQNPTYDVNNGYCQLFVRDPLTGNAVGARELNQNLATLITSGVDAQIDWRAGMADIGLPDWGSLSANVVIGYLETWERQDAAGGPFINRTGTIDSVFGNTFPEWKLLTSLNWRNENFGAGLRWRRIGEMTQYSTANELGAIDYIDLNASWNVHANVTLRAGVNNLTDQEPRVYSPGVQANTDPSTYDVLGRRYYVGLSAKF